MKTTIRAAILIAALPFLFSCNKNPTAKTSRVVILDSWWDVDYAKNVCRQSKNYTEENQKTIDACLLDDSGGIRDFETILATNFATNPQCKGVEFIKANAPGQNTKAQSDALQGDNWSLSIDYIPGQEKQSWAVLGPAHQLLKGEAISEAIAKNVCVIANGSGAKITN
jgi:hypothetical protein